MAPELARGEAGVNYVRIDVYALGVVLYEILTGQMPFSGTSIVDLLRKISDEKPKASAQDRTVDSRCLESICLKAMAKNPSDRYATAGELAAALRGFREPARPGLKATDSLEGEMRIRSDSVDRGKEIAVPVCGEYETASRGKWRSAAPVPAAGEGCKRQGMSDPAGDRKEPLPVVASGGNRGGGAESCLGRDAMRASVRTSGFIG